MKDEKNEEILSTDISPLKKREFEILVDESEKGEKELREKCQELKKLAEKIHKANELKIKENIMKDSEINSLNDNIEKIILNNYDLEVAIQKELELRNKYEGEQKRIAAYCNDLKRKFQNMEKTIQDYEDTIKSMNKENVDLQEAYERKIEQIEKDNQKLEKKIDDRINLHNQQKREIIENQNKVEGLKRDIEQQKSTFQERAMVNKIKYEELEKKYNSLQKKVYELQMIFDIKKSENVKQRLAKSKGKVDEIDVIEKKIKDYENNNLQLSNQIAELTKQWKEMSMGTESTMEILTTNGNRTDKRSSARFSTGPNKNKKGGSTLKSIY
jgi:chromosome segregation ATPase